MANAITGINDDVISQGVLEGFTAGLVPLKAFVTDFSSEAIRPGEKISVMRIGAQDVAIDFDPAVGYTIQDADSDAVELAYVHKYVSWGLNDTEVSKSSVLRLERYSKQKGFQLAKAVFQDVFSIVTAANYSAAVYTGAAAGFDADDMVDIRTAATAADMPTDMRSAILDEDYTGALLKDNAIQGAEDGRPLIEGSIGRLSGFDLFESTLIPNNGQNLVGLVVHPLGIAFAGRYLAPQDGHKYSVAESITDPDSGLTIGVREWYDEDLGKKKKVFECVYAFSVGIANGIKRIVSA